MKQPQNQKEFFQQLLLMHIDLIKNNKLLKILLCGAALSFTNGVVLRKTEVEKDQAGHVISETQKNRFSGKREGYSYTYSPNGDLTSITMYKDDKPDGLLATFGEFPNAWYYKNGVYNYKLIAKMDAQITRFTKQPMRTIKNVGYSVISDIRKELDL